MTAKHRDFTSNFCNFYVHDWQREYDTRAYDLNERALHVEPGRGLFYDSITETIGDTRSRLAPAQTLA